MVPDGQKVWTDGMDGQTDVHPCLQMTTYVANNWNFDTLVAKTSYVSSHIRSCLKLHKSTKRGYPCKF